MEHRELRTLKGSEQLHRDVPRMPLSKKERLERWAELLEAMPDQRLKTLERAEFLDPRKRDRMWCAGSMLSVAFDDPVLRRDGLADDTYGTAQRFFGLTDLQMHRVVCYCNLGATVRAERVAREIRMVIPATEKRGLLWQARRFFGLQPRGAD